MTADRHEARAELLAYLEQLADNGARVPCREVPVPERGIWTSDDHEAQDLAARLCVGCAGVIACQAYGLAWPKEAGVYGAMTEHERRKAAETKETAA
ncbi:MAG: WhiB family transcriptional regulator [Actinomycetales bacterium]|nr:WhiB family transcriptional regulator [Actinomycetales bacterium]